MDILQINWSNWYVQRINWQNNRNEPEKLLFIMVCHMWRGNCSEATMQQTTSKPTVCKVTVGRLSGFFMGGRSGSLSRWCVCCCRKLQVVECMPATADCSASQMGGKSLAAARKLTASREILLWMTPSEAPKALQASECSELLDPMRASDWISAQH